MATFTKNFISKAIKIYSFQPIILDENLTKIKVRSKDYNKLSNKLRT